MTWTLRSTNADDAAWLADLRAEVLRADLTRLGRYDALRVRKRFFDAFEPAWTRVIVVDGTDCGSIAVRPALDEQWIEHFYLDTAYQGRGIGGGVLAAVLNAEDPRPFRLNVLQGSPARRLYERHGFITDAEDNVDVFMVRVADPYSPRD